ncbi:MAG: hypothetical protein GX161_00140 [Firmicutes bacterium]|nr:hypothetical protein [Bacillota bacterium]
MDRLQTFRRIVPEIADLLERRHTVLQSVYYLQPIGRRALAARLDWPERMVRKEIDFLREAGLIDASGGGMEVTPEGRRVLAGLRDVIRDLHGLSELEEELARRLRLRRVIVVHGDSDSDETVKKEIAKATAKYLQEILEDGDVLAVTGGTTLAEVARSLPSAATPRNVLVVPARGGLGEDVELQANTVAANIAQALGGSYRLLHVPDDLGDEAMATISEEPKIKELLEVIRSARVVMHGIGTAEEMARRRGLPDDVVQQLRERRAVGEAFGYYFNQEGEIVFVSGSVGSRYEDLGRAGEVIAVGGGKSKAAAALAVLVSHHQDIWITDEGAAREMLRLLQEKES